MERPKKLSNGSSLPRGSGSGLPAATAVKIKPNEVMQPGDRVYLPVSVAESRISRRYDTIPTGILYPNANEIAYLRRLFIHKDSSIIVLHKPLRLPVKGNLPVHNSMDALAAAAEFSYDYDEGPKLLRVHCAEALGTPIMGDYRYGWFMHQKWKQMPRVDIESASGKPYKLRRPEGLDVQ